MLLTPTYQKRPVTLMSFGKVWVNVLLNPPLFPRCGLPKSMRPRGGGGGLFAIPPFDNQRSGSSFSRRARPPSPDRSQHRRYIRPVSSTIADSLPPLSAGFSVRLGAKWYRSLGRQRTPRAALAFVPERRGSCNLTQQAVTQPVGLFYSLSPHCTLGLTSPGTGPQQDPGLGCLTVPVRSWVRGPRCIFPQHLPATGSSLCTPQTAPCTQTQQVKKQVQQQPLSPLLVGKRHSVLP